jgi:uncharacterized protein YihD (DUF1040 family)
LRDPARIHQIVSILEEYWEKNPDLRLCQVIMNVTSKTNFSMDPYYMEDDLFKKLLEEELAKYSKE